jgi:tetratricopeptide (TPR) repeat protein
MYLLLKEDYGKAIEKYDQMLNASIRTDYRMRATALCKTGNVYREMKKYQHSLYYYDQACDLAEDMEYFDIHKICQYNIACIQQHSTQLKDIEQAQQYFEVYDMPRQTVNIHFCYPVYLTRIAFHQNIQ